MEISHHCQLLGHLGVLLDDLAKAIATQGFHLAEFLGHTVQAGPMGLQQIPSLLKAPHTPQESHFIHFLSLP